MQNNWYRLDTAGLIFPAIRRHNWSNVFRLSVTLNQEIDKNILQEAVDSLQQRFPSIYARLRFGFFWCYLESIKHQVVVKEDYAYPLTFMSSKEIKKCGLRVLYYQNRIAVEMFHSLTDGSGAEVYLRSLLAEYLRIKQGIVIKYSDMVLNPNDKPTKEELEDSFYNSCSKYACRGKEANSFKLKGTRNENNFLTLITGIVDSNCLLELAHSYNCTVTAFLTSVMIDCIIRIQKRKVKESKQKMVKVTIPINLRKIFKSKTLRNFVYTLNLGVDPRLGDYSLEEITKSIKHQLAIETMKQNMSAKNSSNVFPQQNIIVRLMPLFIKNIVMGVVYNSTGERKGSINISNLGVVDLNEEFNDFVERFEFIIGPQKSYPNNCSVCSCKGKTYINMIRTIEESELEKEFFGELVELGLPVEIECNRG